jgi:hypothetical protein
VTTATPDLAARIQDFWAYHPLLQIAHRETKQLVPLKLNQAQLKLYRERVLAAREGRPFRGNYLKARQVGISTVWQAMTAARAFTRANVRAITLAHDDQTTDELHSMLEAMYEHLPAEMKPKQRSREQGKRIVLEYPNGQISRIRTRTAGARVIGRGMNFTDIHASEVAFWADIAESNTALNDAIQELPGTNVLRESTANGKANPFYAICRNSKAVDPRWADWCTGESDWLFFFTPWYDDAGYTMTVPEGGLGKLSDEEDYLRREFMVSDEQLQWRRWRIANKYDGDVSRFWQEMPSWPEQAFLATGRRYFAENSVSRIVIRTPKRGELRGVYPAPYAFTQHDEGRCRYWEAPKSGHTYVLAVDPSGEIPETEAEEYAGMEKHKTHDPSSMHVVDRVTSRIVASWHDPHPNLDELGDQAAMLGKLYHKAIIGVETTGGYGWPVIQKLEQLRYPRVFTTRREEVVDGIARWTSRLGFETTEQTRTRVLAGLDEVMRTTPAAIPDAGLVDEMRTFVVRRRAQHDVGCHDDRVFSAAWAFELARLHPQREKVVA